MIKKILRIHTKGEFPMEFKNEEEFNEIKTFFFMVSPSTFDFIDPEN